MSGDAVPEFSQRMEEIEQFQSEFGWKLLSLESQFDEALKEMGSVNVLLQERKRQRSRAPLAPGKPKEEPVSQQPPPAPGQEAAGGMAGVVGEDYKAFLEKLLQGSLDALSDKISEKLLNMMKELKGMTGPVREAKIKEIREVARAESIDLANLFLHEKVESNLGANGLKIEEKESKAIDKSLEKLRKMKEGDKSKKDGEQGQQQGAG